MKKIELLKRTRLHQILSEVYHYPFTLVEAPMGFGKTTAVRNFLEDEKNTPLWISFLHTGESIGLFWEKFSNEIGKINEASGKKLKVLGFPSDVPQTEKIISVINDINFPPKTVLVIDDFHLAQDSQINKFVLRLVAERIENLHLIVITRDTTPIDFAELFSKGQCYVISQQSIKFTDEEIQQYCHMMSKQISEEDLKKITTYTEGWISLIYMILLGLENGIPVGMNSSIDELIERLFFQVYEEKIRRFLFKLSLMDVFTAKQAHFVTQEAEAAEILRKLQKENAFVYYNQSNQLYKIHNVLMDYLRIKQDFSEEELHHLYDRLGEWYLEKKDFLTAYSYFNKSGQVEKILSHLNNPQNIRNELTGFEGSFELFNQLPKEMLYQYPLAYLQHILLSIVKGDEHTIEECTRQLEELKRVYENMTSIDETYRNRIIAEILIFKRFTSFNTIEPTGERNAEILRLLNGHQSYIMSRENEFTLGSPHLIYVYFRDAGTFKHISRLAAERFTTYTSFANGCGAGCEFLIPAEYALETGDWAQAELNCFKGIYKAQPKEQTSIIICANFSLIRLYILQGKVSEGLEMLKQLEQDVSQVNNPIYNTTIDMCKGYIYACLGQQEKIPNWLETGNVATADLLYQGVAFNYIVYGKAVLLSKNYVALDVLTENFHEQFSVFSNQLGMIHNSIFKAIAKYHVYSPEEGITALEKALENAQLDGIILPFVENAPHLSEMLKTIASKNPSNEFIQKVLTHSNAYLQVLRDHHPVKIKLTLREKEVLTLVSRGLTREEIAAKLLLSQGTVKTHMKNIYQKLEVNGKIAAIKTAELHQLI